METNCKNLTDKNFKHEVLEHDQPVLVEFAAEWSGLCHIIDPIINRLADEFCGHIKFCKIDSELNPALRKTYGVRDLPTLLFFNEGQIVDHVVGALSRSDLSARLENLLKASSTNENPT